MLRDTGLRIRDSAVESIDDMCWLLEKGHTRADFERVVALCRERVAARAHVRGVHALDHDRSLLELLHAIDRLGAGGAGRADPVCDPPADSAGLAHAGARRRARHCGGFDPVSLTYPWTHADPAVDRLQTMLTSLVGRRLSSSRADVFGQVWNARTRMLGVPPPARRDRGARPRAAIPYLNEPWYC